MRFLKISTIFLIIVGPCLPVLALEKDVLKKAIETLVLERR